MTRLKLIGFAIYDRWFSLSLCYVTLYLASISYRQERPIFAMGIVIIVLVKLIGLALNHSKLRIAGIIGINIIWALTILDFAQMGQPLYFSLFALLVGVGISVKGRFNE